MIELFASDFKLVSCQATVFTPDGGLSVTTIMKKLYPSIASRFDADPTVLPLLPEGASAEIPRVILESSSHEWRFEIAAARVNLFWQRTKTSERTAEIGEFLGEAAQALLQYATVSGERIGRLATVASRYAEHETPGLFLARHFCKERWDQAPLNRPANFELHAHKRYSLGGEIAINSWARSKSGTLLADPRRPVVIFEQDLNTLAEQAPTAEFSQNDVARFFSLVPAELDSILRLYYPEKQSR